MADYSTRGVDNPALAGGLAGVVGSLVVLAVAGGLAMVLRRRGTRDQPDSDAAGARGR